MRLGVDPRCAAARGRIGPGEVEESAGPDLAALKRGTRNMRTKTEEHGQSECVHGVRSTTTYHVRQ